MNLTLTLGKRLVFFACITLFCYILTAFIVGLVVAKAGASTPWLRIMAVVQDLLLFIMPAIVTALFCTRLPAKFLAIDSRPEGSDAFIALCVLIAAIPAMNALIMWNHNLELPESMAGIAKWMHDAEESAQAGINAILGPHTVMNLIVSILIVGILAGFSEELFFRGAFQRLLTTGRVNPHLAIWIVAFVFSAIHMQFFGFFPRLLLGAFFGYLLLWSGSLWLPILLHVANNSIFILGRWELGTDAQGNSAVDTVGVVSWPLIIMSVALAGIGIIILQRRYKKRLQHS